MRGRRDPHGHTEARPQHDDASGQVRGVDAVAGPDAAPMSEAWAHGSSAAARPIADDPGSVWRWLATQGSVSRHDLEQLERWYRATMAGSRVPLREIHNLILRIDRQLHHE